MPKSKSTAVSDVVTSYSFTLAGEATPKDEHFRNAVYRGVLASCRASNDFQMQMYAEDTSDAWQYAITVSVLVDTTSPLPTRDMPPRELVSGFEIWLSISPEALRTVYENAYALYFPPTPEELETGTPGNPTSGGSTTETA